MEIVSSKGTEIEVVKFGAQDGLNVLGVGCSYYGRVEEAKNAVGIAAQLNETGSDDIYSVV